MIIAGAILLSVVLVVIGALTGPPWSWLFYGVALVAAAFTLYFFRDPHRVAPDDAAAGNLVLAPADGRIVLIDNVEEPAYIKGPATQISIFLSPMDVHVNRVPADGVIEYEEYFSGEYLVAWHPKASQLNERSIFGLRHPSGTRIMFKQIAGFVARRIVYHIRKGDAVKVGQRFGIVKFGSRMDVLVPPNVSVEAAVGDRVRAGITVLGQILPDASHEHEPLRSATGQILVS